MNIVGYDNPMLTEDQLLPAIKAILARQGKNEVLELLKNAVGKIDYGTGWFDGDRYSDPFKSILYLYVALENLEKFTEHVKSEILEVATMLTPRNAEFRVEEIEVAINVGLLLTKTHDNLDDRTLISNRVLGTPLNDMQFRCDVFVIMPFKQELTPVYTQLIRPVVEQFSLKALRGDDPYSRHGVMREVWSMLNACQLVIADCTGLNPNVFYELGIAHALDKPVIQITQQVNELPFDIRDKRAIEYSLNIAHQTDFKEHLSQAIKKILAV